MGSISVGWDAEASTSGASSGKVTVRLIHLAELLTSELCSDGGGMYVQALRCHTDQIKRPSEIKEN